MTVNLSNKLREMRKRKDLTQKELANKIGVSESYICQIEKGKMISIKKLDKLANALEIFASICQTLYITPFLTLSYKTNIQNI